MGEAINLVDNFKVEKVVFNCGEFNGLEQELIKALYTDKINSNKDWSYLLQLAIYLIKNYEEKHDLLDVEFAYYIFLKYAVQTKDYRPLFDFLYYYLQNLQYLYILN